MTKLEEKLLQLGYELQCRIQEYKREECRYYNYKHYTKELNKKFVLKISVCITTGKISFSDLYPKVLPKCFLLRKLFIKQSKQAFNQLQSDLEVLKDVK